MKVLFTLWIVLLFVAFITDIFVFKGKKHDEIFGAFSFISLIGLLGAFLVYLWI